MAKRRAHGEGSVFRRERDGKWVAIVELPRSPGGKRNRKTYTGRTEREVRKRLKAAQRAVDAGRDLTAANRTVAQYLQHWLDVEVEPSDRSQSTRVGHELNCRRHIIPTIGHVRLDQLDAVGVRLVHSEMTKKGAGPRTIQSAHVTLRAALQHALASGVLERNVASLVRSPRPTKDPSRVHALSPEVASRIVDHSAGGPWHAFWLVLLTAGLRKGEAMALRWSDVSFERATVRVERSLYRHRTDGLSFKPTKTANSTRALPLPTITLDSLQAHRRRQVEARLATTEWVDLDLVFCDAHGRPLDLGAPNDELHRTCRALGIPPERVHNFRHTAATIGGEVAGGDMAVVSRHLGHASISTTIDLYRDAVTASHRRLADGIADVLLQHGSPSTETSVAENS